MFESRYQYKVICDESHLQYVIDEDHSCVSNEALHMKQDTIRHRCRDIAPISLQPPRISKTPLKHLVHTCNIPRLCLCLR